MPNDHCESNYETRLFLKTGSSSGATSADAALLFPFFKESGLVLTSSDALPFAAQFVERALAVASGTASTVQVEDIKDCAHELISYVEHCAEHSTLCRTQCSV